MSFIYKTYNVGFGDFHVISYQDDSTPQTLIIDCGSNLRSSKKHLTYLSKELMKNSDRTDMILTHFHSDHYNIIQNYFFRYKNAVPLRRLFIPSLDNDKHSRIEIYSVSLLQLLFTSDPHLSSAIFIETLPWSLLSTIKYRDIIFIKPDAVMIHTQSEFIVKAACYGRVDYTPEIKSIFHELFLIIPEAERLYYEYIEQFSTTWEAFEKGRFISQKYNKRHHITLMMLHNVIKKRLSSKEYIVLRERIAKLYDRFVNDSGCCIEIYDYASLKALFLSDASPELYKPLIKNINQHLGILKLPHHGTSEYIAKDLLNLRADYYIATNGRGKVKKENRLFDFSGTCVSDSLVVTGNMASPFEVEIC